MILHNEIRLILLVSYKRSLLKLSPRGLSKYDVSQSTLVFTLGILAPLLIAIGQGLPIDCLDMESSLLKELKTK